ncbi:UDP-glycosyltransferase [Nymphaea thermarum]|nr:UDP-glycosyltransferase [Nymphaea thermarum]
MVVRSINTDGGISGVHVVAMPYPGQGHINPMMNLCKRLASFGDLLITFVVTEEWLSFILSSAGSATPPPNLRLRSLPNVIPSERARADDFPAFIEAVYTKMEEPFERVLDQLEPAVSAIVADSYLPWAVDVGNRRDIPVASLWPMAASVFSMLYHSDVVAEHHPFPIPISEVGEEYVDYIPGVPRIRLADLPTMFHSSTGVDLMRWVKESFRMVPKATWLLLNSCEELEASAVDAIRSLLPARVHPIRPFTLPPSPSQEKAGFVASYRAEVDCSAWLDGHPPNSVLYVSLGSFMSVSAPQVVEIAFGLRASGCPFLWIAREQDWLEKEDFGGKGLVVSWCRQMSVLSHRSVGGFFTHCGWNSTTEGISAGVPFLTFPIAVDQTCNSKMIVEDWKIGLRVRGSNMGGGDDELVGREKIAEMVREVMDLDRKSSKEMRRRGRELREALNRAGERAGSSDASFNSFLNQVKAKRRAADLRLPV